MRQNTLMHSSLIALLLLAALTMIVVGCTPVQPPIVDDDKPNDPPDNEPVDKDDPYLVIVSAAHPLPDDQEPELKTVQGAFKMESKAADAMVEMLRQAKEAGITLQVVSAYRSQAKQRQLYEAKVQTFLKQGYSQADAEDTAATIVARPGTSEHNTGLAADVVTPDYLSLNSGFADTDAAKWLHANCSRFGFILRYPDNKQAITGIIYEPWHFRYVGVEHAEAIMGDGLCLEEYLSE